MEPLSSVETRPIRLLRRMRIGFERRVMPRNEHILKITKSFFALRPDAQGDCSREGLEEELGEVQAFRDESLIDVPRFAPHGLRRPIAPPRFFTVGCVKRAVSLSSVRPPPLMET